MEKPGVVVDTGVLISRLLRPRSVPGLAVDKALFECQLLLSIDALAELEDVVSRRKFERYATPLQRAQYVSDVRALAKFVEITTHIRACRDPKDDKF